MTTDLSASAKFAGFSADGWAEIDVLGEDYEILLEIISRQLDRQQSNLSTLEKHGNYPAIVSGLTDGVEVDIGIQEPQHVNVRVNAGSLRAQLCDGQALPLMEITECYCLYPGSKLTVRITRLELDAGKVEACLADSQIELFSEMVASRLDRVQVFNCPRRRLESALQKATLERDVVSIESVTLTTHWVVCKLGTDAIGLIPKLGAQIRESELKTFLPSRILTRCRRR